MKYHFTSIRMAINKRNHQQNEKATYRMTGKIANHASDKELISITYKELNSIAKTNKQKTKSISF